MTFSARIFVSVLSLAFAACGKNVIVTTVDIPESRSEVQSPSAPLGTVISHFPKSGGAYVGSPSIAVAPDGSYVASHDLFGDGAPLSERGRTTLVFRSTDNGLTWVQVSEIDGLFWANLFYLNDKLYAFGVERGHGNIVIMRSADNGRTWTTPTDERSGLLFRGAYHTAPTPVVIGKCRIWRAVEYADAIDSTLPIRYGAAMISAETGSDLLNADNWRMTNILAADATDLGGEMRGWLEGNAVIGPDGGILDIMRVHVWPGTPEYAAVLRVSDDGRRISFSEDDYVEFAGGAKKFTIRYDKKSGLYWTLANNVREEYASEYPASVRNTLSLFSSPDLRHWTMRKTVLSHPDRLKHAFQYADWVIRGDDILFVSRTAWEDAEGDAASAHDANYLTFHRIVGFRSLADTVADNE
ncbi:MAG: exo-alpha-sialidase [Alistipes sp.]|nr:exo-alpha-sialidase [Alistipes sp.]